MTYACTTWELPADTHLMELQSPQNVVLRTDGHLYEVLAALDKAKLA